MLVDLIERIRVNVRKQVHSVFYTKGIGFQVSSETWIVVPEVVVGEACLLVVPLAR